MITTTDGLSHGELRSLGRQIAQFRRAKGLTQVALARIVFNSESQGPRISSIENGKVRATADELAAITAALNGKAPTVPETTSREEGDGAMSIGVAIDSSIDALMALSEDDRAIAIAAILRKIGMGQADLSRVERISSEERPIINVKSAPPKPARQLLSAAPASRPQRRRQVDGEKKRAVSRLVAAMERQRESTDRAGALPRTKVAKRLGISATSLAGALRGSSSSETIEALAERLEAM